MVEEESDESGVKGTKAEVGEEDMTMFGHRNVPCGLQILKLLFSLSIIAALPSANVVCLKLPVLSFS